EVVAVPRVLAARAHSVAVVVVLDAEALDARPRGTLRGRAGAWAAGAVGVLAARARILEHDRIHAAVGRAVLRRAVFRCAIARARIEAAVDRHRPDSARRIFGGEIERETAPREEDREPDEAMHPGRITRSSRVGSSRPSRIVETGSHVRRRGSRATSATGFVE